jgi:hypothetical protein
MLDQGREHVRRQRVDGENAGMPSGVGNRSFMDDMPALWNGVHPAHRVDLLRESSGFSGAAGTDTSRVFRKLVLGK